MWLIDNILFHTTAKTSQYKKHSCRIGTARRFVSVENLSTLLPQNSSLRKIALQKACNMRMTVKCLERRNGLYFELFFFIKLGSFRGALRKTKSG